MTGTVEHRTASGAAPLRAAELFICYSRQDREFVKRLHAALLDAGRAVYVDWADIPAWSPDYESELMHAIDACDTFVFVLSPDSVTSPHCKLELDRAVERGKRVRPLLRRSVDGAAVADALRRPQWIDFSRDEFFQQAAATLLASVDVDAGWVRRHTRIGLRASEWESRDRDSSLLLRGRDLREAENWLAEQTGKEPLPTPLQAEYVTASRRGATRRQRIALSAVLVALVVAIALAALAMFERAAAIGQRDQAISLALAAAAGKQASSNFDVSLRLSLDAYGVKPTAQAASSAVSALLAARRSGAKTIVRAHQGAVASVAFSPDGHTLASAGGHVADRDPLPAGEGDGSLRLWDTRTLKALGRLTGRNRYSGQGVAFSPDGRTLAGVSDDGAVQLWDMRKPYKPGPRLDSHQGDGWAVAFSPDGHTVAAAVGQQGRVQLWDVRKPAESGRRLGDGHQGIVWAVAFSPDGRTLASAGSDGAVQLWDLGRPRRSGRRLRAANADVWAVTFSADGHTVAAASNAGVQLWDLRRPGARARTLLRHRGPIYSLAFSPDGHTLVAAGASGDVWLCDARRPTEPPRRMHLPEAAVLGVAFSPDGHTFASAGADGTVRIWDTRSDPAIKQPLSGRHDVAPDAAALSPDGESLAFAERDAGEHAILRLWDVRRPMRPAQVLGTDEKLVEAVSFSRDGNTLAAGGASGTVWLWDVRNPSRRPRRLSGHRGDVTAVAFSPDGHTLASAGAAGIVLWDLRQASHPGPNLSGHQGVVTALAFSPEGRTLAAAGTDGTVWLWDVRKPTQPGLRLDRHDAYLDALAFSPDGHTLASAVPSQVRLWDVRNHSQLGSPLEGNKGSFTEIAFSPDGRILTSASADGTVRLWDTRSHAQLGPALNGGQDSVVAVSFSADGHTLTSVGEDGTILLRRGILWHDYDDLKALVCRLVPVDLTDDEWTKLAPGLPHDSTCGQ